MTNLYTFFFFSKQPRVDAFKGAVLLQRSCSLSLNFVATHSRIFSTEFDMSYRRDLRQDVFLKDEFHYLNVPRVGTYTVYDKFDCTFECLSNPSCVPLNMAASKGADGKFWCKLLSSEKYNNPADFKGNLNSHHFSIKVGPVIVRLM